MAQVAPPTAPLPDLGSPALQARLDATRVECARLATALSGLTGEPRAKQMEVIDACRRRLDDVVEQLEHAHADGGAP